MMNLQMNRALAEGYRSPSQMARVLTETWVGENLFCPRCGRPHIKGFENNKPVADFFCPQCGSQFELKSKHGASLEKINDGAYGTMISRITSAENPDFLFLSDSKQDWRVRNLVFIPKHFFTPSIIEKRAPLAPTARRAGWIGCNIVLSGIPESGRISVVENGAALDKEIVMRRVAAADNLFISNLEARGWLFDVLLCVERIPAQSFGLSEMYAFEQELSMKHPGNRNVRPKIRQQLQVLRDRGIIEFVHRGAYRKLTVTVQPHCGRP